MIGRSPVDHLIRRTRITGWSAAGAASIGAIGLIAGVGHAATSAVDQGSQPHGGSNGS
jgi:hypothetical protein